MLLISLKIGDMAFMVWRCVTFIFYMIISGARCWAQLCCVTSASTANTQGHESISPSLDPKPRSCLQRGSLMGKRRAGQAWGDGSSGSLLSVAQGLNWPWNPFWEHPALVRHIQTKEEEVEMVHFPDHGLGCVCCHSRNLQEQGPEPAFQISHTVLELQKYSSLSFSGYF